MLREGLPPYKVYARLAGKETWRLTALRDVVRWRTRKLKVLDGV